MKKSIIFILSALVLMSFSACSNDDTTQHSTPQTPITQLSDGTLVIGEKIESAAPVESHRDLHEQEVSAPENSITFEEAVTLLKSCKATELYLPDNPLCYEAFYVKTENIYETPCYFIDLFLNVNGTPIFVGVPYAVSCDGKNVFVKTITGDFYEVEISAQETLEDYIKIYPNAKFAPNDAIKSIEKLTPEQIGIENELTNYYLRFDKDLITVTDDLCYRISVTAYTNDGVQMPAFLFVSASSGTIYKTDPIDNSKFVTVEPLS